jgi:hypothetical protein
LEKRKKITRLEISDKKLEGELVIKDFDNLNYFDCSSNLITSLTIENLPNLDYLIASYCNINNLVVSNCPKINTFNIKNNSLADFNFSSLNSDFLTILDIKDNNFSLRTLEFLIPFVKLRKVFLGSDDSKRLDKNIYNRFYGSLKPLENLKNLGYLFIDSTDVDSGLEYLPEKFKKISCKSKREEASCLKIKKELEDSAQTE